MNGLGAVFPTPNSRHPSARACLDGLNHSVYLCNCPKTSAALERAAHVVGERLDVRHHDRGVTAERIDPGARHVPRDAGLHLRAACMVLWFGLGVSEPLMP